MLDGASYTAGPHQGPDVRQHNHDYGGVPSLVVEENETAAWACRPMSRPQYYPSACQGLQKAADQAGASFLACYSFPMGRVIFGLLKGGIVGAAIGALALKLGVSGGIPAVMTYAVIGAAAGVVCGRPPWRQDTFWTSLLKAIFGLLVGVGLCFLRPQAFRGGARCVRRQAGR